MALGNINPESEKREILRLMTEFKSTAYPEKRDSFRLERSPHNATRLPLNRNVDFKTKLAELNSGNTNTVTPENPKYVVATINNPQLNRDQKAFLLGEQDFTVKNQTIT